MLKRVLWLVLLSSAFTVYAQKAETILSEVNKKYTSLNSYSAEFVADGEKVSLWSKGNKYKVSYGGQEVYNNGKTVYTFIPETNEVNLTDYSAGDESDISPNNIFNLYKKGYKATYKQEKMVKGKKYDVVSLVPTGKSSISKIEMTIGKTDKLISSWTVWNGKVASTYSVTKFTVNPSLSDATFTFDMKKFPNVEVVDLR